MAMERRDIKTKLGNENRVIEARNKERETRKHQRLLERGQKRAFERS